MKIFSWLTAILLSGAACFAGPGALSIDGTINNQTAGYRIGDAVANFRLKSVNGDFVSLTDFNDKKGVIVIFTSAHCPFAKAYEDRIQSLAGKFSGQGFPLIAINPTDPAAHQDDTIEKLKERAASKSYAYSYLTDENQAVSKIFGASRTPQAYVLLKNGAKFTVQYIGMIDDNPQDAAGATKFYVDDAVSNLLGGKPVITTITKPIGCVIKGKN